MHRPTESSAGCDPTDKQIVRGAAVVWRPGVLGSAQTRTVVRKGRGSAWRHRTRGLFKEHFRTLGQASMISSDEPRRETEERMRRLNFLQDEPWDEVNDDVNRVRWFGHPFE